MNKIFLTTVIILLLNATANCQSRNFVNELNKQMAYSSAIDEFYILDSIVKNNRGAAAIEELKKAGHLQSVYYTAKKEMSRSVIDTIYLDLGYNEETLFYEFLSDTTTVLFKMRKNGTFLLRSEYMHEEPLEGATIEVDDDVPVPGPSVSKSAYNDFYLSVIKKMVTNNKAKLVKDKIDYTVYLAWEKKASLKNDREIKDYRIAFIKFLKKNYLIK